MAIDYARTKDVILAQRVGEELVKLYYQTSAKQVLMDDGSTVQDSLTALKTSVETFLTGEADADGVINRLSELVAAIQANKDSIDALVGDKVTKAEYQALLEKVTALEAKAHEHANKTDLDKLSVVNGQVAVDGVVKKSVMAVTSLPEAMPSDLVDGGLLIVG